jgi:predicted DNA-binding protein
MNTPKGKTTSLRLSEPVREKLEYLAKRQNRSLNNLVDTLLAQVLGLRDLDERGFRKISIEELQRMNS